MPLTNQTPPVAKPAPQRTPHDLLMQVHDFAIVSEHFRLALGGDKSLIDCHPELFDLYARIAKKIGFTLVREDLAVAGGYELLPQAAGQWVGKYREDGKEPQRLYNLECHFAYQKSKRGNE